MIRQWLHRRRLLKERRAIAAEKLASVGKVDDDRLVDPIEDDPVVQPILREAEQMAEAELADHNHDMGFCHLLWRTKQRILARQFSIVWFSPAEMNPYILFD